MFRLQLVHSTALTHSPHDVDPLQHEWSWSTDSFFDDPLRPVTGPQMKQVPPWDSKIWLYRSSAIEYVL